MGVDPFVGSEDSFTLSLYVIDYVREMGFSTLNHIRRLGWLKSSSSYWLVVADRGLGIHSPVKWMKHIGNLNIASIQLMEENDWVVWAFNKKSGQVTTK